MDLLLQFSCSLLCYTHFCIGCFCTLQGDGARLNISQSTFATASAGQAGGAVFGIDLSSVSFVSSEVDGSEGGSGGCASIEGVDIVSVVDSKMHNCNALSGVGIGA